MNNKEANIRFVGTTFHGIKWDKFLKQLEFRRSGGNPEKYLYTSGGNNLIIASRGFINRDDMIGYEWQVVLKQSRRWECDIKFWLMFSYPCSWGCGEEF